MLKGSARDAERQRLAVPARPAQAGPAEPRPDGALPRRRRRRPRRRRRGRRRRDARAAARARGLARSCPREGPVLGSRPRLGQRREGLGAASTGPTTRIISGNDPIEMGKNNSGVGVGGSMTHFAGYVPRLHPSDFEVRTRDGVAVDWPISYWELKESFERVELELPVAGQDWPWGDPHGYPHAPAPDRRRGERRVGGRAQLRDRDARRAGRRSRTASSATGRTASTAASASQGCKVNAKASPADHASPRRDRARRARCAPTHGHARRGRRRERPRAPASSTSHDGVERFQRADAVAVCGYAIETPRLLLNSASRALPERARQQRTTRSAAT